MKIGILTFYRVDNFGANLQALSTYCYLKKQGHEPVMLEYVSRVTAAYSWISDFKGKYKPKKRLVQKAEHLHFIDSYIKNQIRNLRSSSDVLKAIKENRIDAIIVGSDAVVQHWPMFSTLKFNLHRPYWFEPFPPERRFPNPFWGIGYADRIPTAMMAVSSQNSPYRKFTFITKKRMKQALGRMRYISVRDAWTKNMMYASAPFLDIDLMPDPVFALNQNLGDAIPSENEIRSKFRLPQKYVLVGLRSQIFSVEFLKELNEKFKMQGKECVAFNIDGAMAFNHPFAYETAAPISPLDWFALIKYSAGYIGCNMHPIVSALTCGVPCFSIDNWGSTNFWGRRIKDGSSKVQDVLSQYDIVDWRKPIENGFCDVSPQEVVDRINAFPVDKVRTISAKRLEKYNQVMRKILSSLWMKNGAA
jgi:hypothetical protein